MGFRVPRVLGCRVQGFRVLVLGPRSMFGLAALV